MFKVFTKIRNIHKINVVRAMKPLSYVFDGQQYTMPSIRFMYKPQYALYHTSQLFHFNNAFIKLSSIDIDPIDVKKALDAASRLGDLLKLGHLLKIINDPLVVSNKITQEICDMAIHRDIESIKYIPTRFKTEYLCLDVLNKDGLLIQYMKDIQTDRMCIFALHQNLSALSYMDFKKIKCSNLLDEINKFRNACVSEQQFKEYIGRAYFREIYNMARGD